VVRNGDSVSRCAAWACPLVASADTAIYDEAVLTPELFLSLVRTLGRPTILFARDVMRNGRHNARFVRALDHRGGATVFPHLR
jgi:hypothetical protein